MFFIMGISQGQKKLDYNDINICSCCGKYSSIEIYMAYYYFMLFFIPLIKWNKEYYVKTNCCNKVAKLDKEIGLCIQKGENISIDFDKLDFGCDKDSVKICSVCKYTTTEDFTYCPKCSNKL